MARRVFFSFHYERDAWRVSQVRNSWIIRGKREAQPFYDGAKWESIKKQGDAAVKKWIEEQLKGCSVTVVLIGAETADRKYVRHEIQRSHELGKGMLGIYIHNLKDSCGHSDSKGKNPFDNVYMTGNGSKQFSGLYSTYDWIEDNGYRNIASWVEQAAPKVKSAGLVQAFL